MSDSTAATAKPKVPQGIPYIIGNEAAERFSYYGMRTILVIFMTKYLLDSSGELATMSEPQALQWFHSFAGAVYMFPILGALIADVWWGKYKTILSLSIIYCLGHLSLALMDVHFFAQMMEPRLWLGLGLGLIAIGSGGIKPCVSAHVGDQFKKENASLLEKFFGYFYFSINFGAFFSTLLTPYFLQKYGPSVAFGVPGLLMFLATIVFWLGRKKFIAIPSVSQEIKLKEDGTPIDESVGGAVTKTLLIGALGICLWQREALASALGLKGSGAVWGFTAAVLIIGAIALKFAFKGSKKADFEAAKKYSREVFSPRGLKAIGGLSVLYVFIACFWALYDQTGSSWVLQADKMDRIIDLRFGPLQWDFLRFELLPSQIQAINPILIMAYIPIFTALVYPFFGKFTKVTPLRKIGAGFFVTGISFSIVAYSEQLISSGANPSIFWQFLAFAIITAGEVLISITALEFSYTQAPNSMKSVIMGLFLLSVSIGNFITAGINSFIENPDGTASLTGPAYYWLFVGLVFAAGALFIVAAYFYKEETYIQDFDPDTVHGLTKAHALEG